MLTLDPPAIEIVRKPGAPVESVCPSSTAEPTAGTVFPFFPIMLTVPLKATTFAPMSVPFRTLVGTLMTVPGLIFVASLMALNPENGFRLQTVFGYGYRFEQFERQE